jgi:hypothetical protein
MRRGRILSSQMTRGRAGVSRHEAVANLIPRQLLTRAHLAHVSSRAACTHATDVNENDIDESSAATTTTADHDDDGCGCDNARAATTEVPWRNDRSRFPFIVRAYVALLAVADAIALLHLVIVVFLVAFVMRVGSASSALQICKKYSPQGRSGVTRCDVGVWLWMVAKEVQAEGGRGDYCYSRHGQIYVSCEMRCGEREQGENSSPRLFFPYAT